jgi:hypothetical protein
MRGNVRNRGQSPLSGPGRGWLNVSRSHLTVELNTNYEQDKANKSDLDKVPLLAI